jgi:hypothetical protein
MHECAQAAGPYALAAASTYENRTTSTGRYYIVGTNHATFGTHATERCPKSLVGEVHPAAIAADTAVPAAACSSSCNLKILTK